MVILIMLRSRLRKKPVLVSGCMFYFPLGAIYAEHRREFTARECPPDLRPLRGTSSSPSFLFPVNELTQKGNRACPDRGRGDSTHAQHRRQWLRKQHAFTRTRTGTLLRDRRTVHLDTSGHFFGPAIAPRRNARLNPRFWITESAVLDTFGHFFGPRHSTAQNCPARFALLDTFWTLCTRLCQHPCST